MLKIGTQPKTMPMTGYIELEDWVHDTGRMVLIGEAAHPIHVSESLLWSVIAFSRFCTARFSAGIFPLD